MTSQTSRNAEFDTLIKKYYGYDSLKKEQYDIINNIIDGRDVCAVLSTSYGKSMCYQIPFLYTRKCVLVISPLIALMDDQTRQLNDSNIPVCNLNSSNTDRSNSISAILKGENKIIYTTPEYITRNLVLLEKLYNNDALCLIAIDESHCISNWGNDFRPDYQKLSYIRNIAPGIPMLALTATATKKIQDDICGILQLHNPLVIVGDLDRPNLYISISKRTPDTFSNDVVPLLKKYRGKKILIYCRTIKETDNLTIKINNLQMSGIKCDSYHASRPIELREACQRGFTNGDINCVVATIAFGMGININNIRLLIHYNCPGDIEEYYQEIGRAGRDGLKSECHMFFSHKDFIINKYFNSNIKNPQFRFYKDNELKKIQNLTCSLSCRRYMLLKHFNTKYNILNCNNCDICCRGTRKMFDCTNDSKIILNLLQEMGKCYGIVTIVQILKGSNTQKMDRYRAELPNHFGSLNKPEPYIRQVIEQLVSQEYIYEHFVNSHSKFNKCTVFELTYKGMKWLSNGTTQITISGKNVQTNEYVSDDTDGGDTNKGNTDILNYPNTNKTNISINWLSSMLSIKRNHDEIKNIVINIRNTRQRVTLWYEKMV